MHFAAAAGATHRAPAGCVALRHVIVQARRPQGLRRGSATPPQRNVVLTRPSGMGRNAHSAGTVALHASAWALRAAKVNLGEAGEA